MAAESTAAMTEAQMSTARKTVGRERQDFRCICLRGARPGVPLYSALTENISVNEVLFAIRDVTQAIFFADLRKILALKDDIWGWSVGPRLWRKLNRLWKVFLRTVLFRVK